MGKSGSGTFRGPLHLCVRSWWHFLHSQEPRCCWDLWASCSGRAGGEKEPRLGHSRPPALAPASSRPASHPVGRWKIPEWSSDTRKNCSIKPLKTFSLGKRHPDLRPTPASRKIPRLCSTQLRSLGRKRPSVDRNTHASLPHLPLRRLPGQDLQDQPCLITGGSSY